MVVSSTQARKPSLEVAYTTWLIHVLRPSRHKTVISETFFPDILNVTQGAARNAASVHFRPSMTRTDILVIKGT